MKLIFRLDCPKCHSTFDLFSREHQNQRLSDVKQCPSCGVSLVPEYSLWPFLSWLALFTALSLLAAYVWGPTAMGACFVPGVVVALFSSVRLREK